MEKDKKDTKKANTTKEVKEEKATENKQEK